MIFTSSAYVAFLIGLFFAWWGLSRFHVARVTVLLLAGWAAYALFNPWYLVLLLGVTVVDYGIGLALAPERPGRPRRWVLAGGVALNLGLLAVFKYAGFLARSADSLAVALGTNLPVPVLDLALPVGVSFYSFQGIGYLVDVYRRRAVAERSILHYALFQSFFATLTAGPIPRATGLLPQMHSPPAPDDALATRGLFLVACGLVKKIAIADLLGRNLVDRVFDLPTHFTAWETLAGVYGYTLQIYCDFSGYSDIAIGSALLLGLRLPDNFRTPYLASGPRDFWRRWHIALSTWLRDYLYVPLGGSRRPDGTPSAFWRTSSSLLLTMLLGGLWHGASWTFVAWGGLHGLALVWERAWRRVLPPREERPGHPQGGPLPGSARSLPRWRRLAWRSFTTLLTFHFVAACWVLFRAEDWEGAMAVFQQVASGIPGCANLTPVVWAPLLAGYALHLVPEAASERALAALNRAPVVLRAGLLLALACSLAQVAGQESSTFIYFQF
jgi:D-alanyl-lipoteichoic acid acyltransferase DltB (MBOAT superfamily)